MELLSPAGSWESMIAAVQNGADAVYLGGGRFSARRFAKNFTTDDDLSRALDYCHVRDVRVQVTVNTLLLDREMEEALSYAAFLYEAGADALIVQDLGLAALIRQQLPKLPLYASTQMAVHDKNGLEQLAMMGFSRAVLARELRLCEIEQLHRQCEMPLECFAHGALCTAVSGMCLFSSMAGGRSGNRGACAQPCRKAYTTEYEKGRKTGYPLSLGDLSMLFHVKELASAGVSSIKLEGRMKRPEYVAAVTRAYRMALSGASEKELREAINAANRIFNRGEAGTGYYFAQADVAANRRGALSDEQSPLSEMRETYRRENKRRDMTGVLTLMVGEPARLKLALGETEVVAQTAEPVQPAGKTPDAQRYRAQVGKLFDTPFTMTDCRVEMPVAAYISAAALNGLRRQGVSLLMDKLAWRREGVSVTLPQLVVANKEENACPVIAIAPNAGGVISAVEAGADMVALSPNCYDMKFLLPLLEELQPLRHKAKLLLQLPAAAMEKEEQGWLTTVLNPALLDGGIAQHMSQLAYLEPLTIKIAGPLCNAANGYSVAALRALGFDRVAASLELNRGQMRDMIRRDGVGAYAYGRAALMQLLHCPVKAGFGCQQCALGGGALVDEAGRRFSLDPVHGSERCLIRVRNCEILDILHDVSALPRPDFLLLEFTDENEAEVRERVAAGVLARAGETPVRMGTTRGHWNRGWD